MDRDHTNRLRETCSLSVLNQRQLAVVRSSKSTDNLHNHHVAVINNDIAQANSWKPPLFFFRKTRKREKIKIFEKQQNGLYRKQADEAKTRNESIAVTSADDLSKSWQSSLSSSRSLFNLFRVSRSRSSNNNSIIMGSGLTCTQPDPCCSMSSNTRSTLDSMEEKRSSSASRRRRPRSAHIDPNTLLLPTREIPVQNIDDLYRRIEKLGEGSYAIVYKCENRNDGNIVALKEIKLQNQEGLPFTAIREASLLRALRHSNIVTLHDIVHEQNSLVFVFEYMKTDLSKYLELNYNGLDPIEVRLLLFQLLRGLAFCHEKKILHRDLKPQNLLLNEYGELKLADFGLARAKSVPSRTYSHEVVTLWYRPPDVLLGSTNYSSSLDLWGVGCIFAEMCTGAALFPGTKDVIDQLDVIFSIRGVPNIKKWPNVLKLPLFTPNFHAPYRELAWNEVNKSLSKLTNGQTLLTNLLQLNPDDRISASAAMMHPYFACLPAKIHILPAVASIFTLQEVRKIYHSISHL